MNREEAIKKLKDILEEATETDDSVCYVTSDDADALKVAIDSLEIDERYELEYEDAKPKTDVLDKIRAEIEAISVYGQVDKYTMYTRMGEQVRQVALDIIDKYRKETKNEYI